MGAAVTPDLAAAVIRAGGLGMVPCRTADQAESAIGAVRALVHGPLGAGILAAWADRGLVERAAAAADVVDFFWGGPDAELVDLAKGAGAIVGWQVGSVAEAVAAERSGCHFVSVQGVEAGGHVSGDVPLERLLADTIAAVRIPWWRQAASDGGAVTRVLDTGAAGVRIGTRFLAAVEADVHPGYLAALIASSADDTLVTEAFHVGWPDAPHRVLRSAVEAAETRAEGPVGYHDGRPVPRFSATPPRRATTGDVAAMALYAGTSVAAVTRAQSADAIVEELMAPAG